MGFWSVLALIVGAQLGTGMFLLPAQLAEYGVWGIVSWGVTGAGALALSFVFAVLSKHSRYAQCSGGAQTYILEAFGYQTAFYSSWIYWVISWVSSIPVVLLYGSALEGLVGGMTPGFKMLIQIGTLVLVSLLNLRGALISGIGEIFFSLLKVVPLLLIPGLAFFYSSGETPVAPSGISMISALHQASLLGFWGYIGLECGTAVAPCVKNAHRVLPRALILGSLLVTSIYLINTWSVMYVLPTEKLITMVDPYSAFLAQMLGGKAGQMMSGLIALMCLGTLNSWILASGQIALTSAQQGLLPAFFARVNQQDSPYAGILVTGVLLSLGTLLFHSPDLTKELNFLMTLSTSLFILIYFISVLALGALMRQKVVPQNVGNIFLVLFSAFFCLWSLSGVEKEVLYIILILPLSGWILQKVFRSKTQTK
jgi:basic amino acid/polyamine antiporter, APA family